MPLAHCCQACRRTYKSCALRTAICSYHATLVRDQWKAMATLPSFHCRQGDFFWSPINSSRCKNNKQQGLVFYCRKLLYGSKHSTWHYIRLKCSLFCLSLKCLQKTAGAEKDRVGEEVGTCSTGRVAAHHRWWGGEKNQVTWWRSHVVWPRRHGCDVCRLGSQNACSMRHSIEGVHAVKLHCLESATWEHKALHNAGKESWRQQHSSYIK